QSMACAFACANAMCKTQVNCNAGAYQCDGNNVEICNGSGSAWLFGNTCKASCQNGFCVGACTPGELRCNGNTIQTCNNGGNGWNAGAMCMTFCVNGACALDKLDVQMNTTLDGEVWVAAAVTVRVGATLSSPKGNLTIHAQSISVDQGASITVAPTGM